MPWQVDQFDFPIQTGTWLLLSFIAVSLGAWLYLRRPIGLTTGQTVTCLVMRLCTVGMVAWVLAGPSRILPVPPREDKVPVLMLADTSRSMAECDVPQPGGKDLTRWEAIANHWFDANLHEQMSRVGRPIVMQFDDAVQPVALGAISQTRPTGEVTRLYDAITQGIARSGQSDQAGIIVLLSDGNDTQRGYDRSMAASLSAAGWRVFSVPVGQLQPMRDVSLSAWADSDFLYVDQTATLHVDVRQSGLEGQAVSVKLYHEENLIQAHKVVFDETASARLKLKVTPPADKSVPLSVHGYRVVAEPLAMEQRRDNNSQWVFVQVSNQHVRVLLLEGDPYWDTRFLARVVQDDPQMQIWAAHAIADKRITIQKPQLGEEDDIRVQFPLKRELIRQFDVVVLGRSLERLLPDEQAQLLVDYVMQDGGAVVFARGNPYTSESNADKLIAPISPVTWSPQRLKQLVAVTTPEGRSSPLLELPATHDTGDALIQMPDLLAATRVKSEKAAAVVLLRQQPREGDVPAIAAIAHHQVGAGRTLAVMSDGMWQWATLPTSLRDYDTLYQQFWSRTIRWLAYGGDFLPGQAASLRLSKLTTRPDEPVGATLHLRDMPDRPIQPVLTITDPSGKSRRLTMTRQRDQSTRFVASVSGPDPGVYQIQLQPIEGVEHPASSRLAVTRQTPELVDLSAKPIGMIELAQMTGGKVFRYDEPERLLDELGEVATARRTDEQLQYDFNRPIVFAVVLLALALEWLLRRRAGLL